MNFRKHTLMILAAILTLAACGGNPSSENQATETAGTPSVHETSHEEIVRHRVTNAAGQTLQLEFDNANGTLTAVLNGETITMNRDTTGSGVAASNDRYKYSEWHGNIKLEKDGTVIFEGEKQP